MATTCEIINEVAKEIGFPELKDKQQEAALSFLKGNDVFAGFTANRVWKIISILPFVFNKIKG